jgi:hypothetical protein
MYDPTARYTVVFAPSANSTAERVLPDPHNVLSLLAAMAEATCPHWDVATITVFGIELLHNENRYVPGPGAVNTTCLAAPILCATEEPSSDTGLPARSSVGKPQLL